MNQRSFDLIRETFTAVKVCCESRETQSNETDIHALLYKRACVCVSLKTFTVSQKREGCIA
jgi:hypothetical protein